MKIPVTVQIVDNIVTLKVATRTWAGEITMTATNLMTPGEVNLPGFGDVMHGDSFQLELQPGPHTRGSH